jgi:selenide,water dikinase
VVGGHTIDDPIPKYGMAVVGMAHPDRLFAIDQARAGDQLILTKPIGTGVIATALKNGAAPEEYVRASVASMTQLNAAASEAALAAGLRAATDVTGFGLLGHLHRMLRASGVAAEIRADRVPLLPGARELAAAGFVPGGTRANMSHLASVVDLAAGIPEDVSVLLHDAQTSGGLLLAVPPGDTRLLGDLLERGLPAAAIGRVRDGSAGHIGVLDEQE